MGKAWNAERFSLRKSEFSPFLLAKQFLVKKLFYDEISHQKAKAILSVIAGICKA